VGGLGSLGHIMFVYIDRLRKPIETSPETRQVKGQ